MKLLQSSLLMLVLGFSDAWNTALSNYNSPVRQLSRKAASTTSTARHAVSTSPQSIVSVNRDEFVAEKTTSITPTEHPASSFPIAAPVSGAISAAFLVGLVALAASPESASAVVTATASVAESSLSSTILTAGGSISSALFAYGHYFSILGIVGILMTERWTLENGPNLTEDEENRLAIADTMYGVIGLLIVYTGYYRVVDPALGKGSYFYLHEPVFWLKMAMVGVLGAASLFNTTTIIQRSVSRFTTGGGSIEPMSEALCDRMKSICNAQLTGIVFIPMAATFMARGIGYNDAIPWQAEAGATALVFLGLGFKYVKEALTFEARRLEAEKENKSNTVVS